MRKIRFVPACLGLPSGIVLLALGLGGCGLNAKPRPVAYVAAPPPGARVCVEYREDMYGRRYCSKYYGS